MVIFDNFLTGASFLLKFGGRMRACNIKLNMEDLTVKASLYLPQDQKRTGPLHFHSTYELQYVNAGGFSVEVERKRVDLSADFVLAIAPQTFHQMIACTEDSERISMELSLERNKSGGSTFEYYRKIFGRLDSFLCLSLSLPELREMKAVMDRIGEAPRADERQVLQAYFTVAFFKISEALMACEQNERGGDGTKGQALFDHDFAGAVINFIIQRYTEDITVAELAEYLGFSVRQTERIIRKNMASTFSRLLNEYRIQMAGRMISHEEKMTLEAVGYAVGYHDYHCFLKQFKRYAKVTPSAYRKSARTEPRTLPR